MLRIAASLVLTWLFALALSLNSIAELIPF